MAGCTDPGYSDSNCPHKDNSGQQLLGLIQCSDSQADGMALWSACPGPTTKTALGAPSQCSCSGTTAGLLWMTTSLSALATLPTAIGETIQFNEGHYPTVKSSVDATSTIPMGSIRASTTSVSSITAPPSTRPTSANSTLDNLSIGAEVGIGIGAILGAFCMIGLVFFALYRRRLARQKGINVSSDVPERDVCHAVTSNSHAHGEVSQNTRHSSIPGSATVGSNSIVPNDGDVNAYTGYKFELPADSKCVHRPELPADEISPALHQSRQFTPLVSPISPRDTDLMGRLSPRSVSATSSLRLSGSPGHERGPRASQERRGDIDDSLGPFCELSG